MIDRRSLIAATGALLAPPALAQQRPQKTVGYLSGGASQAFSATFAEVKKSLAAAGFAEGQNLTIQQRWAEGSYDRLPALAAELVALKPDLLIASGGDRSAFAAKAATTTIPIVCTSGDDPVATGLVQSLARPGGNVTGVSILVVELHSKRLELLHELIPDAKSIGLLSNSASPQKERVKASLNAAASSRGLALVIADAATDAAIDSAMAGLATQNVRGVLVQSDPYFIGRYEQITALAQRHKLPAVYEGRRAVELGGLISYGADLLNVYRQLGEYAGLVLKGTKPADLPVVQPTRFELALNVPAAKALGLAIPQSIQLRVDTLVE